LNGNSVEHDFRAEVLTWLGSGLHDEPPLLVEHRSQLESNQLAFAAGGTRQRVRSQDPLQAGYYDLPRYRELVAQALVLAGGSEFAVDLGCGDGRGVQMLLAGGVARVLGVDFNPSELRALWDALDTPGRRRTALVCASVRSIGRLPIGADVVLMLEVLSTLTEPDAALDRACDLLRPGGVLLVSDPVPEALFVHALINCDWDNVLRLIQQRVYADDVAGHEITLQLRAADMLEAALRTRGLEPAGRTELPARSALLLHALRRAGVLEQHAALLALPAHDALAIPRARAAFFRKPAAST
jgi:SAM-dependent methyltransferase